jgi:hypothetical protein
VVIYNESAREIVLTRSTELMKEVVIAAGSSITGSLRCRTVTMGGMTSGRTVRRTIKDTVQQWISDFKPSMKIYPNPLARGNAFTVSLKIKQTGNHTIQITDAAGRMVLQQLTSVIAKEQLVQLQSSSNWSAGIYYITVKDEKGKLISTGNVVLQ